MTVALVNTAGYLYASVTVIVLDSQLKTFVRFPGGRTYPHAAMIWPAALLVLLLTFLVARYQSRLRVFLVGTPLVVVSSLSNLFIFPQELPHMAILYITAVWIAIVALWTWAHDSYSWLGDFSREAIYDPGVIECLKETANFYRTMAFGLVAAALALLVAGVVGLHGNTREVISDPREVALMNAFQDTHVAVFMLLLLFGPIFEALRAWQRTCQLLLALRSDRPQQSM